MPAELPPPRIVLTLGGMKASIDDVRFLANTSSGLTGSVLASELSRRGAQAFVLLGWTEGALSLQQTEWNHRVVHTPTYTEMRTELLKVKSPVLWGIFAAAVLDYVPEILPGKIDSSLPERTLKLERTEKLVDVFHHAHPEAQLVTFKLESRVTESELIVHAIRSNLQRRPTFIVANRREDVTTDAYRGFLLGPLDAQFWNQGEAVLSRCSEKGLAGRLHEYRSREALASALCDEILP